VLLPAIFVACFRVVASNFRCGCIVFELQVEVQQVAVIATAAIGSSIGSL